LWKKAKYLDACHMLGGSWQLLPRTSFGREQGGYLPPLNLKNSDFLCLHTKFLFFSYFVKISPPPGNNSNDVPDYYARKNAMLKTISIVQSSTINRLSFISYFSLIFVSDTRQFSEQNNQRIEIRDESPSLDKLARLWHVLIMTVFICHWNVVNGISVFYDMFFRSMLLNSMYSIICICILYSM